ncbi:MAG: hypothetical protein Q8N63_05135 [Nanoarchaeota archaeon]|nr:hypothetical protein [Nanoarchaeota archaeon]
MKKEKIVKIQKILGIILLVVGIVLLCWNLYNLNKIKNYEDDINTAYAGFLFDDEKPTTAQGLGPTEEEKTFIDEMVFISFIKGLGRHSLYFSLILIVLGLMTLLQAAFNKAKK